jgi:hypothetical protein
MTRKPCSRCDSAAKVAELERQLAEARDALAEQYAKVLGHANMQEDRAEAAEAEVQALKAELAELREYRDFGPRTDEKRQAAILGLALGSDRIDRMEALQSAEAEVARLREALRRIAEKSIYTRSEFMQDIAHAALATPENGENGVGDPKS